MLHNPGKQFNLPPLSSGTRNGEYYKKNDMLRLYLKPKKSLSMKESLTYNVRSLSSNRGEISMAWEYLSLSFGFENF